MNQLIEAILEDDFLQVRQLISSKPELMAVRNEAGLLPADLAYKANRVRPLLALLRTGAPSEVSMDLSPFLMNTISEISEDKACARWLIDVEFYIWHGIVEKKIFPKEQDLFRFTDLDHHLKEDLKYLADLVGGWPTYEEIVPLDEWHQMYDKWKERVWSNRNI